MSLYDGQAWPAGQGHRPTWSQQLPPQRPVDSPASSSEVPTAFLTQIEEVDRALDNLSKSGKFYAGGPIGYGGVGRRDNFPVAGRGYAEIDGRTGGPRNQSISDYDVGRPGSTVGMQGFTAPQRFQPRPADPDQVMNAQRRIAAQREREMRNFHQEQQYSRHTPNLSSERPLSPSSQKDEERRDLIARQHRALYGQDASLYPSDAAAAQRGAHEGRPSISGVVRGPSPLSAFDNYGMPKPQSAVEGTVQMPLRDAERRASISPPSGGRSAFGAGESRSPPLPGLATSPIASQITSPTLGSGKMPSISGQSGIGPIGRRPVQTVGTGTSLSASSKEQSPSSTGNPGVTTEKSPALGGWGSSSGVWGAPKNSLGVQASVWG